MEFKVEVGKFIKRKRKEKTLPALTIKRMAEKVGVTRVTMSNVEKGRGKPTNYLA